MRYILIFVLCWSSAIAQITPEMFGAIGNGVADDYIPLQKAIDSATKTNGRVVLNKPRYRTTKSLEAVRPQFRNFSIVISGRGTYWDTELTTIFYDAKQGHALNIQNGKGCVIEGINFVGKYKVPLLDVYTTPWEDYNDTSVIDKINDPYCAITVDFHQNGTRSGSTGIFILKCSFRDFTGAINYSPNGVTLNNEMNLIQYCRGRNLKYFFSGGQAQEKMNIIEHCGIWDNVHTVFVWARYGQGQPGRYTIRDINLAGKIGNIVWRPSQGFFALFMDDIVAESVGSVGFWNTTRNDALMNSDINLQFPDKAGYQPAIIGQGVRIQNTSFRYYNGQRMPVMLKGRVKLSDNVFDVNPIVGHRYIASDPLFEKGFKLANTKMENVEITNGKCILQGSYKINDVIVFYQTGNFDFLGMGQVTQVIKGLATVSYINLKSGKYRYGTYEQIIDSTGGFNLN